MKYPMLNEMDASRQMIDSFGGYNHNLRINDGEFFDMKNMTSDHYPVLSPRGKRGFYIEDTGNYTGLIAKDSLCYVDGSKFVINEYPVEMGLNDEPKQLISMGAYVIIMPDKKWINTLDHTYGNIEASYTSTSDVTFSLCTIDGAEYNIPYENISNTEPTNPENLELWIDTSSKPRAFISSTKRFNKSHSFADDGKVSLFSSL